MVVKMDSFGQFKQISCHTRLDFYLKTNHWGGWLRLCGRRHAFIIAVTNNNVSQLLLPAINICDHMLNLRNHLFFW